MGWEAGLLSVTSYTLPAASVPDLCSRQPSITQYLCTEGPFIALTVSGRREGVGDGDVVVVAFFIREILSVPLNIQSIRFSTARRPQFVSLNK